MIRRILKKAVEDRGISYAELARRTGMDAEALRRSIAGSRKITGEELIILCHELNLTFDSFAIGAVK